LTLKDVRFITYHKTEGSADETQHQSTELKSPAVTTAASDNRAVSQAEQIDCI